MFLQLNIRIIKLESEPGQTLRHRLWNLGLHNPKTIYHVQLLIIGDRNGGSVKSSHRISYWYLSKKIQILANNKISFTGSYQVKLVRINSRYFSTWILCIDVFYFSRQYFFVLTDPVKNGLDPQPSCYSHCTTCAHTARWTWVGRSWWRAGHYRCPSRGPPPPWPPEWASAHA